MSTSYDPDEGRARGAAGPDHRAPTGHTEPVRHTEHTHGHSDDTGYTGNAGYAGDAGYTGNAGYAEDAGYRDTGATPLVDRDAVLAREKEEHGGIKIGSAFFGWLTATGTAVLLTALLAAAGAAVGIASDAEQAVAGSDAQTIGIVGGVALLVILFVAYFCGGYVAGRMARFDGAKQGLAVWLWALAVAVLVAVLGLVAGNEFNVLAQLNTFPRIPLDEGDLTTGGLIAVVAAALVSLLGAVLGGKTGMRFHRRVDRAGLGS